MTEAEWRTCTDPSLMLDIPRGRVPGNVAPPRGEKAAAILAQLNQDIEAKRHVYNAFLTRMERGQYLPGRLAPRVQAGSASLYLARQRFLPIALPTSCVSYAVAVLASIKPISRSHVRQRKVATFRRLRTQELDNRPAP